MAHGVIIENTYHARSTSMPARSHPLSQSVEEELSKLKAWAASLLQQPASPPTAEVVAAGLAAITGFYDCVDDLLASPRAQQAIRHFRGEKLVADLLDVSVRMLDVCSTTRESLALIREHAKEVQSALRRRCADYAIDAYVRARMDAKKDAVKCLKALRHMEDGGHGCACIPALDNDANASMVIRVLQETRAICVSFLQALLSLLSSPSCGKSSRPSKWSLVSRAMLRGKQLEGGMDELEMVDDLVRSLHRHIPGKDMDASMVQTLQRHLGMLETRLVCLEDALGCAFRCLIQNRVSLLNVLST